MSDQPPPAYTQTGGYPPQSQQSGGAYPPPQGHPQKQPMPPHQQPYPGQPYPQQQHHQTTIITQQPGMVMAVVGFGEAPVAMICPFCQANITTGTTYENGDKVWLWMAIFCFLGGLLCFWIPLVMDSLKDVHHHCPNCKRVVGTFKR